MNKKIYKILQKIKRVISLKFSLKIVSPKFGIFLYRVRKDYFRLNETTLALDSQGNSFYLALEKKYSLRKD